MHFHWNCCKSESPLSIEGHPSERRLVLRLLDYWRRVSEQRRWPSPGDFYPAVIPDLWRYCFLIDLKGADDKGERVFSYVGDYHREMYDLDLTGVALAKVDENTLISRAASYIDDVLAKAVPVTYGGQFVDRRGYGILYRSILLPLSTDNQTISAVLGAANCQETAPDLAQSA
jgi:hypothetical protein